MPAESGRKIAYGLGRETTPGTGVAAAYWAKHLEGDFGQKITKADNESALNVLEKTNGSEVMEDYAEGNLGGKVTDKSIGLILAAAFGAAPVTTDNADVDATVKDHTFDDGTTNTPLSLSIGLKDLNRDERYALARMSQLELEMEVGQWFKWMGTFVSKKPTNVSNTVAYVAENEFKAKHATVKLAANVAGLSGASALALKRWKLTRYLPLNRYHVFGSNDPDNIYLNEREGMGDFAMLYDANTHRDSVFNNTVQAMQITLQNTDVTIGSAARPTLVLTFPRVTLNEWSLDQGLGSMVEQTLGFKVHHSLADGYAWRAVLTNTVASY